MKYFLTLSFVAALSFSANSQMWFDLGLKGSFGPTMMFDQNVFDHGSYKHTISTGHAFGARLGINSGYHLGLSLEYSSATSKQEFDLNSDPYSTYNWKHNDLIALIRYSGNGAYVELGGKYSNLKEVELELDNGVTDRSGQFEDSYTSGIFGFGSYLAGNDLLSLNLGIRIHWAFTDMVNETGKEARVPFADYPVTIEDYDDTNKSLATAAQLQMEINYAFGRFSKEACHDRWKLILFQ